MMRKASIVLPFLLCFLRLTAQSQDFKWKSALDTVSKTGFYAIPLGLEWLAVLKTDLSDIRINNERKEVVPFIIQEDTTDPTAKEASGFYLFPKTVFSATDSTDGNTYVWINNEIPYPVDRITMKISGPRFYKRNVKIYQPEGKKIADVVAATEFNSNKDAVVWLMGDKAQTLLAVIENGDNPPLKIESVHTQVGKRQLVAYLEAGKRYFLVGGNATAVRPQYDLAQFRDSIPASPDLIGHGQLVANTEVVGRSNEDKLLWLWPAIILMIGILALLTVKLMRDMRKKNI